MLQAPFLAKFQCLGDRCEDTCCQTWSMQVDDATHNRYSTEAPELLADVVPDDTASGWIMRKDAATGLCVRLEGGLCSIHKERGDRMLGDACHFYPRVTRALGQQVTQSATLSCPEVTRLVLTSALDNHEETATPARLPASLKNYLPAGMQEADALTTHQAFLNAARDESVTPEHAFLRIARATRALEWLGQESWHILTSFYITDADLRIPPAAPSINDNFNLLHMLCGLVVASHKPASARLKQTFADMETALASKLNWQNVTIETSDASIPGLEAIQKASQQHGDHYAPYLRRWLHHQLGMGLHPFSGFGKSLTDIVTLLGVRFAILKLALLSAHVVRGQNLPEAEVVRVIQSLSRLLDHLGDSDFCIAICTETGWIDEARMHGLIAW